MDLVDVAQDNAIAVGVSNALEKIGVNVFGASQEAGRIEWDKAWARNFMTKYKIPTPKYFIFTSPKNGIEFVKKKPGKSWFIKAAGLAEVKGVLCGKDDKETVAAIKKMSQFGSSGKTFVLEEWLLGEEFSGFAFCDGNSFKVVGYAQDHKRVFDGDQGPNTGGMGCVSNPLIVESKIKGQVEEIFAKVTIGMKEEGHPYKGVLYLGGMVVKGKVKVIEFNSRWGDPEAEVILSSIGNDFVELIEKIIFQELESVNLDTDKVVRVAIAVCAKGYPIDYSSVKGKKISGVDKALKTGAKIYGAGIKQEGSNFVVNGGRVLYVIGEGRNVLDARERAYQAMKLISIEGDNLHYRKDIGWRDVERIKGAKI